MTKKYYFLVLVIAVLVSFVSCSSGSGDKPSGGGEEIPGLVPLPEGGYVPETGSIAVSSTRTKNEEGVPDVGCVRTYRLSRRVAVSSPIKKVTSGDALLLLQGGNAQAGIDAARESVAKCAATYATTGPATASVDEYTDEVCPKDETTVYHRGSHLSFPEASIPAIQFGGSRSGDANQYAILFGLNRDGTYLLYLQIPLLGGNLERWDDNDRNSHGGEVDATYVAVLCKGAYESSAKEISSSEPGTSCSYVAGGEFKEPLIWTISFQSSLIIPAPEIEPLVPKPATPQSEQPVS